MTEIDLLTDQLSTLVNSRTNYLEGWFSDAVDELLSGDSINNVRVKGGWPTISWDGEKLIISNEVS